MSILSVSLCIRTLCIRTIICKQAAPICHLHLMNITMTPTITMMVKRAIFALIFNRNTAR